jgi:hypothetical protein
LIEDSNELARIKIDLIVAPLKTVELFDDSDWDDNIIIFEMEYTTRIVQHNICIKDKLFFHLVPVN